MDTGQLDMSVAPALQVPQSLPQSTIPSAQPMVFMILLAGMINLLTQESVEKASPSSQ